MLWFDWQVESNAASSTACAVVDEANEGAARLLDAPAAELRGRPLRSLFTRECWPEIERELARTDRPAPRTLALELLERGERCAPARARLLAPGRTRGTRGPTLFVLPARARPAARELPPVSALVCTRLARGLLHDLRSPLMAISGFAEVLAFRHAAELGSDARRCVDNIVAATRRLEHMVELLASETRLGAGELEPRPLDLRELLRGLAVEGRAEAFELHLAAGLPLVGGDALVLRGAFAALVALAQGAPAARPARVRIELSCEHERPRVRIDGPGQPSDAPDSAVAAAELALARRALELHGWQLRGTAPRFEVELPAPGGK